MKKWKRVYQRRECGVNFLLLGLRKSHIHFTSVPQQASIDFGFRRTFCSLLALSPDKYSRSSMLSMLNIDFSSMMQMLSSSLLLDTSSDVGGDRRAVLASLTIRNKLLNLRWVSISKARVFLCASSSDPDFGASECIYSSACFFNSYKWSKSDMILITIRKSANEKRKLNQNSNSKFRKWRMNHTPSYRMMKFRNFGSHLHRHRIELNFFRLDFDIDFGHWSGRVELVVREQFDWNFLCFFCEA